MENKLRKLNWKIAGPGVIIIVLLALFIFSSSKKQTAVDQQPSNQTTDSQSSYGQNGGNGNTNNSSANQNSDLQTFQGVGYTIDYPKSWKSDMTTANSVVDVTLEPNTTYVNPVAPTVAILSYAMSEEMFKAKQQIYKQLGYDQLVIQLNNGTFTEIEGTTPAPVVNGKSYGNPMVDAHYFILHNNLYYEIIVKYQQGDMDSENQIDDLLATFSFT